MVKRLCIPAQVVLLLYAHTCLAQPPRKVVSLCILQQQAVVGERLAVRVAGVYQLGVDQGVLSDPACPDRSTWVELRLKSDRNKQKLSELLRRHEQVYVVLEGEFYGPGLPDPRLPESLRRTFTRGWGHLGSFRTKIEVAVIREVRTVRASESMKRNDGDRDSDPR